MSIQSIPEIKVSSIDLPVYSFDYSFGGASGPSTFRVSFVSKTDSLPPKPTLSASKSASINIKGFKPFSVFLKKYEREKSSGGYLLHCEFVDTSIILDKIFIGLYNRHGFNKGRDGNVIILGNEVDPCSRDSQPSTLTDPCDPCPEDQETSLAREIDCAKKRQQEILDVRYNFSELRSFIGQYISGSINDNDNYYATYTGTLRDVLSNWCSDYGYTFYWSGDRAVIIDLKNKTFINTSGLDEGCNILSCREGETIENSTAKGIIGTYLQSGETKEYQCDFEWARRLKMFALSLDDVIPDNASILGYYENRSRMQFMMAASYYSETLRDLYVWYTQNEINSPSDAESKIGEVIKLMGNLKIKKVFSKGASGRNGQMYAQLLESAFPTAELREEAVNKNVYFFSAEQNPTLLDQFRVFENSMAKEFLGKYFVRRFKNSFALSPNAQTPYGSVEFYKNADEFNGEFVNLLPEDTGKYKSYLNSLEGDSYFVLNVEGKWFPQPNESENKLALEEAAANYAITEIGVSDLRNELKSSEKFFYAYEKPSTFTIAESIGDHLEGIPTSQRVDACGFQTSYGYNSNTSKIYSIAMTGLPTAFKICMPPQAHDGGEGAGFTVILCGDSGIPRTIENPRIIDIERKIPSVSEAFNLEVNTRDFTENVAEALQNINNVCQYNTTLISNLLRQATLDMEYEVSQPLKTASYTLCGLPAAASNIGPDDGLDALSIRYGGDGVITTLSFSEKRKKPLSQSVTDRLFELKYRKPNTIPWAQRPAIPDNPIES